MLTKLQLGVLQKNIAMLMIDIEVIKPRMNTAINRIAGLQIINGKACDLIQYLATIFAQELTDKTDTNGKLISKFIAEITAFMGSSVPENTANIILKLKELTGWLNTISKMVQHQQSVVMELTKENEKLAAEVIALQEKLAASKRQIADLLEERQKDAQALETQKVALDLFIGGDIETPPPMNLPPFEDIHAAWFDDAAPVTSAAQAEQTYKQPQLNPAASDTDHLSTEPQFSDSRSVTSCGTDSEAAAEAEPAPKRARVVVSEAVLVSAMRARP